VKSQRKATNKEGKRVFTGKTRSAGGSGNWNKEAEKTADKVMAQVRSKTKKKKRESEQRKGEKSRE